jgi:AAA+ superfamily predicted ATPase
MNNGRFDELISVEEEQLWDERGYASCWEHYADELKLLDIKLQWLYHRRKKRMSEWQADPFNGMFVSEEEFLGLIGASADPMENDPDALLLLNQLRRQEAAVGRRLNQSESTGVHLPLPYAARIFGMQGWERQCVMIALAVELDRKYERIFGFLIDDLTCKHPNISLLLQLACRDLTEMSAARMSLSPSGKLAKYMLYKEVGDTASVRSLLSKSVWLDRRMVRFLLDETVLESSETLDLVTQRLGLDEQPTPLRSGLELQERIKAFVREMYAPDRKSRMRIAFYIWGPSGGGKKLQVQHCCRSFGKPVLFADLSAMLLQDKPFDELLDEVLREAILHQTVLCLTHVEALFPDEPDMAARQRLQAVYRGLNGYNGLLFMLADKHQRLSAELKDRLILDMELPVPDDEQRRILWESLAQESGFDYQVNWAIFGSKFRFTPGQIGRALLLAKGFAAWNGTGESEQQAEVTKQAGGIVEAALYKACYMQVQHRLEKKATRIQPKYAWEDIILPVEQKEQLRQACNQMKYRSMVYGQWGFERKLAYGKGLSMLFAGPPGTGKTMSAQVVAKELQLELYKIDLSQVISKYIGETEKNLHEIFEEARLSNAILFFDETDALFGKRSEVKDSHDKYANIETAYLLQKMEEYEGITVLATNLLNNIDEAFIRRINYIIKFPFPDDEHREKIWRSMFPKEAPIGEDVDFKYIAAKFSIAGGSIKNIAVSSAFMAADAGTVIGMRHILQAIKYELQKTGKIWNKDDVDMY